MKEERLQVRIDLRLKKQAMAVARGRHTTLSSLIVSLLQHAIEVDRLERSKGPDGDVESV